MKKPQLKLMSAAIALALAAGPVHAALERVGPNDPSASIGHYPAWYQDGTGITLEFCDPKNASEVEGGWCLLLPTDIPVVPENFPNRYFDEHFYFAANALMTARTGSKATLVLAEEAAFATGLPVPGAQITFSRIRVKLTAIPVTGTYRFIHPYGEDSLEGVAGGVIFFTDDVGIGCPPGQFDCSLSSRLGPFLLPSATPGGAEMPPLTETNPVPDTDPAHFGGALAPTPYPGNGKAYIADPGRIGPVTGSPLPNFIDSTGRSRNHNIFRIEGPVGSGLSSDPTTGLPVDYIETTDFSLMGRLMTGALPDRVSVERATYSRGPQGNKVDVFAGAFPTMRGRLPASPLTAPVLPNLSFFGAPCAGIVDAIGTIHPPFSAPVGAVETPMIADGDFRWGQVPMATIPTDVCVKDNSAADAFGTPVPTYAPHIVTDEVTIAQAVYDTVAQSLTVAAVSSDETVPPTLAATFGSFRGDLVNGQLVVAPIVAPPASVRVQSSARGVAQLPVTTSYAGTAVPPPVAADDVFSMTEDAGLQILPVLANDSNAAGGTVAISVAPRLGSAAVNPDGTVSFTPNANAFGTDSFSYLVAVGAQASNVATVSLSIAPINDAPTAVNDAANAFVNTPVTFNVLANDSDPDGAADLVAAVVETPPAGATVSVSGDNATFNAAAAGTYTFTYRAQDSALALSANAATVTVQVAVPETLAYNRVEYVVSQRSLLVEGTVSPAVAEQITFSFVNSAGTVLGTAGTATSDAAGRYKLSRLVPLPAGTTAIRGVTAKGTVQTHALSIR